MSSQAYSIPSGVHAESDDVLDLRSDSEIDHDLLHPPPISASSEKNVWFFWHSGFSNMHPYTQRNVRAWHRRFSKRGWTIRVLDRIPDSPLNVERFLDVTDLGTFPRAFVEGVIGGDYGPQHTSDLVRFPLLIKYGGVYADVGMMQIGDLDRLWSETVGNPASPYEVLSYNIGGIDGRNLTNYFLATGKNNPFFQRCHDLLLALWAEDGGKADTKGMHTSLLLKGVPHLPGTFTIEEDGKTIGPEEVSKMLSDYIIQGQVIAMVMGLVDDESGWDGPRYCAEHIYAMEYMVYSQLINEHTAWNGQRAFDLMSLSLPKSGEPESEDQVLARTIVEDCLRRSFGFKLAHGLILRVFGHTLGSLWRKHVGSDDVPGTYGHWLRYGIAHWAQDDLPPRLEFKIIDPIKKGALLRVN